VNASATDDTAVTEISSRLMVWLPRWARHYF